MITKYHQHIAAAGIDSGILRLLLMHGASVHLRNKVGRTPLFVAAQWGLLDNIALLRESGAHLHAEEIATAKLLAPKSPGVWQAAGLDVK